MIPPGTLLQQWTSFPNKIKQANISPNLSLHEVHNISANARGYCFKFSMITFFLCLFFCLQFHFWNKPLRYICLMLTIIHFIQDVRINRSRRRSSSNNHIRLVVFFETTCQSLLFLFQRFHFRKHLILPMKFDSCRLHKLHFFEIILFENLYRS